jgi:hypothetical protein
MSIYFRRKPPTRVRDLSARLNVKGKSMSIAILTWTAPTTRAEVPPRPLSPSEIDHSTVFDGTTMIGTVVGATTGFTTGTLTPGTHVFTVTVTDTLGNTSAASNASTVLVPVVVAAPSAITDLVATLSP